MFQINWNKHGPVELAPFSVTAISGGYRETIHAWLRREENGDWVAHMAIQGGSKPVCVPADIVEEAREIALMNGVRAVRWNGERFFPMDAEGRVIQPDQGGGDEHED